MKQSTSRRRSRHPEGRRHHHLFGPEGRGERRAHSHGGFGGPRPGGPHFEGPGFREGPGLGRRGPGGWRSNRAQRGDVRAAVLVLLDESPMHGYQLMQEIAERTQGAWRPSPGAIYPAISQLEDEGLVEVARDQGRKLVTLTQAGRDFVAEQRTTLGDPFATLAGRPGRRADLRGSLEGLVSAVHQVARSGSTAQQEAAQDVLRQARKSVYLILADDDPAGATKQPGDPPGGAIGP